MTEPVTSQTLPDFLEACQTLGLLRIIVTSSAAVLELRGTIANLFYAELPGRGHYANMHHEDFEFHLNMDAITQVKFEEGESKRGNFTTYAVRFLDQEQVALSLFLQWGKPGEYAPGQVEAWQALKARYGEVWEPIAGAPAAET